MKSILVQLDDSTLKSLNRVAPTAKRKRAAFIREAIRRAVRDAEFAQIRAGYEAQPDSEDEADDWSNAEEFKR